MEFFLGRAGHLTEADSKIFFLWKKALGRESGTDQPLEFRNCQVTEPQNNVAGRGVWQLSGPEFAQSRTTNKVKQAAHGCIRVHLDISKDGVSTASGFPFQIWATWHGTFPPLIPNRILFLPKASVRCRGFSVERAGIHWEKVGTHLPACVISLAVEAPLLLFLLVQVLVTRSFREEKLNNFNSGWAGISTCNTPASSTAHPWLGTL